jgi:hypothetical protein
VVGLSADLVPHHRLDSRRLGRRIQRGWPAHMSSSDAARDPRCYVERRRLDNFPRSPPVAGKDLYAASQRDGPPDRHAKHFSLT